MAPDEHMTATRTPCICVEHGGFATTGDYAMLANVVRKLRLAIPEARILVRREPKWCEASVPGADGYFEGLHAYYRDTWQAFFDGPHKWVPRSARGTALAAVILLATLRLFVAAVACRLLRTTWLCPRRARAFMHAAAGCDLFYVAGNGGMTDTFLFGGLVSPCAEVLVARLLGARVVLSGLGVGPLRSRLGRAFVRRAFARSAVATVRELHSLSLLRELRVAPSRVTCTGDDAHDLPVSPQARDEAEATLARLFDRPVKTVVAVNVRMASYAQRSESDEPAAEICRALEAFDDVGVLFVPMRTDSSREVAGYERVAGAMADRLPVAIAPVEPWKPQQVKALIGACDLAIGYSYHFLVFALSSCVPAIGVYETDYYAQKVSGLMERYGLADAGIELGAAGWQDRLRARVRDAFARRDEIARELSRRGETLARQIDLPIREVRALVGETP